MLKLFVGEHAEHGDWPAARSAARSWRLLPRCDDAGVVAGHHGVEARARAFEQRGELDFFRCSACEAAHETN